MHKLPKRKLEPIRIELVGGPEDGLVLNKPVIKSNGFLPSALIRTAATYAADVNRPLSSSGAHRYLFRQ